MSYAKLPYPHIDDSGGLGLPDPDEVNANFIELFRVVNGNIGAENLAAGQLAASLLENPNAVTAYTVTLDTSVWSVSGASTAAHTLFQMPDGGSLLAVGVSGASTSQTLGAILYADATSLGSIADENTPIRSGYLVTNLNGTPTLAADDEVKLQLTAGTVAGSLTLYMSMDHV